MKVNPASLFTNNKCVEEHCVRCGGMIVFLHRNGALTEYLFYYLLKRVTNSLFVYTNNIQVYMYIYLKD